VSQWSKAKTGYEKSKLVGKLQAAKGLDQELLSKYLGDKPDDLRWQPVIQMFQDHGASEATDYIRSQMILDDLEASGLGGTDAFKRISEALEDSAKETGYMTRSQLLENIGDIDKLLGKDAYKLTNAINNAYGTQDQTTQISDLFGSIGNLVSAVNNLVAALSSDEQAQAEAPVNKPTDSGGAPMYTGRNKPKQPQG
jgi:hypothetical protein